MDLPSTEKVYKHDVTYQEGSFECKTCGTIASTMDAITFQPCTRRGVSGEVPGKSGDCMCQLIEFSFDWPTKVQEMIGNRLMKLGKSTRKMVEPSGLPAIRVSSTTMVRFPKRINSL